MSPRAKMLWDQEHEDRVLLDGLRCWYSAANMSILEYVFTADGPRTISEIVEATGLRRDTVSGFLAREGHTGIIERVRRGVYQRSPRTYRAKPNFGL